jgi:alanine dehydrogenase
MRIGVPREVKTDEYRVALTPAGADELIRRGHTVVIETTAGDGAGFPDAAYVAVGATIADVDAAWGAELVLKVKEPQPGEFQWLREDATLFTYLHLAAGPDVATALLESGTTAIAYETVEDAHGRLPLLAPMSEIAGRLSVQAGAKHLERPQGGRGVLLGGVAGVAPANVLIVGGGIVGINAAMVAVGMQAHVYVLDVNLDRLRDLELALAGRVTFIYSTRLAIQELLPQTDLLVGAVLVPGAKAPRLVIHYCVANMPGAVPITSTQALCNATLPYVRELADMGIVAAIAHSPALQSGVNVRGGRITNQAVAEALAD